MANTIIVNLGRFMLTVGIGAQIFWSPIAQAKFNLGCKELFQERHHSENLTQAESNSAEFLDYLSLLINEHVLDDDDLKNFAEGLSRNLVINPIQLKQSKISSQRSIHHARLNDYLTDGLLDILVVRNWIENEMSARNILMSERQVVAQKTLIAGKSMVFYPIPPGGFVYYRGEGLAEVIYQNKVDPHPTITLTHHVEVSSELTTQAQWFELMGENPAFFRNGDFSPTIRRDGKVIDLLPDHPIESISWWSALVFANEVSRSRGFPETYDFSGIMFFDIDNPQFPFFAGQRGSEEWKHFFAVAAKGKLSPRDSRMLPKINAPYGGYIYNARGYRLLTAAEHLYLRTTNRKRMITPRHIPFYRDPYHGKPLPPDWYTTYKNRAVQSVEYGWTRSNSGGKTHPVGELLPRIFEGYPFFDLVGNVWEMSHDFKFADKLSGLNPWWRTTKDPYEKNSEGSFSIFGAAFDESSNGFISFWDSEINYNQIKNNVGFRLARTLDP